MVTIENIIENDALFKGKHTKYEFLKDGIENKTYKVDCGNKSYCVRIINSKQRFSFGLDTKKEALACQQASLLSIAPAVYNIDNPADYLITDFFPGKSLTGEEACNSEIIKKYICAIKLIHDHVKVDINFSVYDRFYKYIHTAKKFDMKLPNWVNKLMEQVEKIKEIRSDSKLLYHVFCHNDIWHENILFDGNKICLIDWEFCGYGDGFFDFAHISRRGMLFEEKKFMLTTYFGYFDMEMWRMLQLMEYISRAYDAIWQIFHSCVFDDIDTRKFFTDSANKIIEDLFNEYRIE